jgi:hypothetical protein
MNLKKGSISMVDNCNKFLGICSQNGQYSEPDLAWVGVFVVLHYHQYIKIFEEKHKNWDQELSYFKAILEAQRVKRNELANEYFGMARSVKQRISFEKIVKALAWVKVAIRGKKRGLEWFNFETRESLGDLPIFDKELKEKYGKYVNY